MDFKTKEISDFYECDYNEIPKIIHIIWKGGEWPQYGLDQIYGWQSRLDASWTILPYNDGNLTFIKENADEYGKRIFKMAEDMPEIASYVDIIRLYIIYIYGGYYFDADFQVFNSLEPISHVDSDLIICNSTKAYYPYVDNSFFAAKKEDGFIKYCLDTLLERYESNPEGMKKEWIVSRTGPIFFGEMFYNYKNFKRIVKEIPFKYLYRNQPGDGLIINTAEGIIVEDVTETFEERFARHMFNSNCIYN